MSLSHFVIKTVIPQNLDSMNISTAYFFPGLSGGEETINNRSNSPKTILTILNF